MVYLGSWSTGLRCLRRSTWATIANHREGVRGRDGVRQVQIRSPNFGEGRRAFCRRHISCVVYEPGVIGHDEAERFYREGRV